MEANFTNTLDGGQTCNDIDVTEDFYKEGLETFILWLESDDAAVCFGRDQALLLVPSNDGKYMMIISWSAHVETGSIAYVVH